MTNPNDPASPIFRTSDYSQDITCTSPGLTKREEFAKAAMQGLCANPYLSKQGVDMQVSGDEYRTRLATEAILQADALIAALNKGAE